MTWDATVKQDHIRARMTYVKNALECWCTQKSTPLQYDWTGLSFTCLLLSLHAHRLQTRHVVSSLVTMNRKGYGRKRLWLILTCSWFSLVLPGKLYMLPWNILLPLPFKSLPFIPVPIVPESVWDLQSEMFTKFKTLAG
jgi:hypothetical protein